MATASHQHPASHPTHEPIDLALHPYTHTDTVISNNMYLAQLPISKVLEVEPDATCLLRLCRIGGGGGGGGGG